MTETIYRFKRSGKRGFRFGAMFIVFALLLLLMIVYRFSGMETPLTEAQAEGLVFTTTSLMLLLACIVIAVGFFKPGAAKREFLKLGDEGLAYGNLFGVKHWPWRDLSAFALGRRAGSPIVTFSVAGKLARSVNQIGTKALIEDIYDAPLTDIAAKLNEYRDRVSSSPAKG